MRIKKAFTLIEILIAVLIIAILATITLAFLRGGIIKARCTKSIVDVSQIERAVDTYLTEFGWTLPSAGGLIGGESPDYGGFGDITGYNLPKGDDDFYYILILSVNTFTIDVLTKEPHRLLARREILKYENKQWIINKFHPWWRWFEQALGGRADSYIE